MQTQQTDLFIKPAQTGANQSSTSFEAAAAIRPHAERIAERIIDFLEQMGPYGATCDEIERSLDMIHSTASSRLVELNRVGKIAKTQKRRATRTGCKAVVWTLATPQAGHEAGPRRVSKRTRDLEGALQFLVREISLVAKQPQDINKPQHVFVSGFISKTAVEDARKLLET